MIQAIYSYVQDLFLKSFWGTIDFMCPAVKSVTSELFTVSLENIISPADNVKCSRRGLDMWDSGSYGL